MNSLPKVVLFPHGPVRSDVAKKVFEGQIHACGGDLSRLLDNRAPSPEEYMRTVHTVSDLRRKNNPPIVVLTETTPLGLTVIKTRRILMRDHPVLETSLWIVYADVEVDPSFQTFAETLGAFDDADLTNVPYWTEEETGNRYLILTSQTRNLDNIALRARGLVALQEAPLSHRQTGRMRILHPRNPEKS